MSEKFSFDVDTEFLQAFYGLAGKPMPNVGSIELRHLKQTLTEITTKLSECTTKMEKAQNESKAAESQEQGTANPDERFGTFDENGVDNSSKKALIIDDLGVITYQLSVLFKKLGFETTISQEIYNAISNYKEQFYDLVILDLYIPTEREGFLLLDELVKINNTKEKKSVIGVMTASSKKEHKLVCRQKGANFYIEKIDDWQKNLIELCKQV